MVRTSAFRQRALSVARSPARSIGIKLFLIFVSVVCLAVAGLGRFASDAARSGLMDELKRGSAQTVSLVGEKLDMKMSSYANLSGELIRNNDFLKPLFQLTNASLSDDERLAISAELRGLLDQAALSDATIRDVTLFPLEDEIAPISTIREADAVPDARNEAWIREIAQAGGKEVWLPMRERGYFGDSPKPLFAYGKLLGKTNVGSRDFALLVQIEASAFSGLIQGVRLSEHAETDVLDANGNVLLSNSERPEGSWASKIGVLGAGNVGSADAGSGIVAASDGRKLWTAYRQSPVSGWTLAGVAPLDELIAPADRIRTVAYAAVAGCFALALLVGLWLVRLIGTPLRRMESLMMRAADGHLTDRMSIRGRDELGRVAEAYNRMMERLGAMVAETMRTSGEVASASLRLNAAADRTTAAAHDIRAAAEQIALGAENLAAGAERGNAGVERIGERLKQASALQERMSGSAAETGAACRDGSRAMDDLVRRAEETELRLRKAGDRFVGLKEGARDIRGILDVMERMSKQIRILSLNASIEATRAGAAGAGFKVIAEEIRRLAEQTDASIANVGRIAGAIGEEVEGTSSAMDEALPFFRLMLAQIAAVDRTFVEMRERMDRLGGHSSEVDEALRTLGEQGVSLTVVMGEVAAIAQQSTAASEETASRCRDQASVSEELLEQSRLMQAASDKLALQMRQFHL